MRGLAWVGIVAATGIGFTAFLSVLAEVGLAGGNEPVEAPPVAATAPPAADSQQDGLRVVAKDTAFSPKTLTAPAGEATIAFSNQDPIPHNFHLFEGDSNAGKSVGATDPKSGPDNQTLKVSLAAGEYFFQCDVHPKQMTGTLTVSAGS